jgi:uncharacterized protein YkwD
VVLSRVANINIKVYFNACDKLTHRGNVKNPLVIICLLGLAIVSYFCWYMTSNYFLNKQISINEQPTLQVYNRPTVGKLLSKTNIQRNKAKVKALVIDEQLNIQAQNIAQEIRVGNSNPDSTQNISNVEVSKCAQSISIFAPAKTANEAVFGWVGNQDTRDVLLNNFYDKIGIGVKESYNGYYNTVLLFCVTK